jgi:hypothetical protein
MLSEFYTGVMASGVGPSRRGLNEGSVAGLGVGRCVGHLGPANQQRDYHLRFYRTSSNSSTLTDRRAPIDEKFGSGPAQRAGRERTPSEH